MMGIGMWMLMLMMSQRSTRLSMAGQEAKQLMSKLWMKAITMERQVWTWIELREARGKVQMYGKSFQKGHCPINRCPMFHKVEK